MSIVLEGVSKRFGGQRVVEDVTLNIADGELFVLLGASGSGKSTILRLIAGLSMPDRGRILIGDRDVTALPPQSRGTGFVFQNYSLFRHMTVADNVEFGLRLRRMGAVDRAERRESLLSLVELSGLGDRMPDQLSGGQRQRVALARALAYTPSVLLLDEPFGALDAKIRTQLRRSLREVQDRLDVTTVLVTHDQEEAFELADRVGIVDRGRLVEVGAPEALYARPRTLFAATFLGAGAVLAGTVEGGAVRFGTAVLALPAGEAVANGSSVRVLVRPEHVTLHATEPVDEGPAAAPVLGRGTVVESAFTGAQRRVRVQLPRTLGCRQLAPRTAFGSTGLLIDAAVPAALPYPPDAPWVALTGWHVLAADVPRILWCVGPDDTAPPPLLEALVRAMGAHVRVLGVAANAAKRTAMRERLDGLVRALEGVDVLPVVRHGDPAAIVLSEQAGADWVLTVLPPSFAAGHAPRDGVDDAVREVLEAALGPVLVLRGDAPPQGNVLVCTAAGEPGKGDVEVGGRIAARLGATVTLLYVNVASRRPHAAARGHLDRAAAALGERGLVCKVRERDAVSAAAGIADETRAETYDVVVIGGHGPRSAGLRGGRHNVTAQVLEACEGSVLVVPDTSGG